MAITPFTVDDEVIDIRMNQMVDEVSSAIGQIADRGYLVSKKITTQVELDNLPNGKYWLEPFGELNGGWLEVINHSTATGHSSQLLNEVTGGLKVRTCWGGAWNNWKKIALVDNVSNPNLLINGDFSIWQRGTSFTNPNESYTADRWRVVSAVDAYISISKMSDYLRMQVSVLNTSGAFTEIIQPLEKIDKLIGKHVTMSAQIIPDLDTSGEILIVGTKDGVEQSIASNLTSNRDSNNIVTASGLISEGSWTNLNCRIRLPRNYTPVGKGISVKWVKLELGEIATPFSPRTYAEELAMCQRYYQYIPRIRMKTSLEQKIPYSLPVVMRFAPTISYTGGDSVALIETDYSENHILLSLFITNNSVDRTFTDVKLDAEIY